MFASLCILGRQPAIGLAELESLYGAESVQPIGNLAALLDKPTSKVSFAFLGGTVKFCKVLTELETIKWPTIQKFLIKAVPEHASMLPVGKMRIGLSVYGLNVTARQVTGTGLQIKKELKNSGRSVRVVPNNDLSLNSAQVLYNQLTAQLGWELVLVKHANKTIVAQTIAVQDIDSYSKRDRERPKRDARVGMLPPKLAQIIINMATSEALNPDCEPSNPVNQTILDPFCGTGVILQEAALMGYQAIGTDIEQRMINYAKENVKWLKEYNPAAAQSVSVEVGDATTMVWTDLKYSYDYVAAETYLGRPFTTPPTSEILNQTSNEVNTIVRKFLQNFASQTKSGFRLCLALPAWKTSAGFKHLSSLENLKKLGYNRVSFVHADDKDLIYYREGQFVGRELVTLIRI